MSPKPEKGRWLRQIPGIQSEATNEFEGDLIKGTFSKLLWKSGIMKRGGERSQEEVGPSLQRRLEASRCI